MRFPIVIPMLALVICSLAHADSVLAGSAHATGTSSGSIITATVQTSNYVLILNGFDSNPVFAFPGSTQGFETGISCENTGVGVQITFSNGSSASFSCMPGGSGPASGGIDFMIAAITFPTDGRSLFTVSVPFRGDGGFTTPDGRNGSFFFTGTVDATFFGSGVAGTLYHLESADYTFTSVPEPAGSGIMLLGLGILCIAAAKRAVLAW